MTNRTVEVKVDHPSVEGLSAFRPTLPQFGKPDLVLGRVLE